jgi:hypothetical protein
MLGPEIMQYYRRGGERHRLAVDQGRLEFLRTWDVLTRVLPAAPASVLDVGGASPRSTDQLLDMLRRVESEPTLLGASSHVLTVARTPGIS